MTTNHLISYVWFIVPPVLMIVNAYFRELLHCKPVTTKHLCGKSKNLKNLLKPNCASVPLL